MEQFQIVNFARISRLRALLCAIATILIAGSAFAATGTTRQLRPGEKAKMSGLILSRDGDLVRVRDKKSHEVIAVSIGDATQIERKNHVQRIECAGHAVGSFGQ
ncbi:MAG TPA: hypothetical protein VM912_09440 [Terriglobales bacterium]|nr:hypothetical protein [Terriglobales bacterium]